MRCAKCYMPDTRPGSVFIDGVCQACRNYEARERVNWELRATELSKLCDRYRGHGPYDCLIPVSGGKDSHTLCHILVKEMDMHPLLCTVADGFTHTKAGTANLNNLLSKFNLNHWMYTISLDLFRRATRVAFEETGEPLKFIEYAIYTVPVKLAHLLGIPLVFFGENSAYEYGSTDQDSPHAYSVIEAISDKLLRELPWWTQHRLNRKEVESIAFDTTPLVGVHYMSYYRPWSSMTNLSIAKQYGFKTLQGEWERESTIENFEQMDSYGYMIHLWMKYPKFGFQRVSDVVSRRIREGHLTLEAGKLLIETFDRRIDPRAMEDFCRFCGYTEEEFWEIARRHDRGYLGN